MNRVKILRDRLPEVLSSIRDLVGQEVLVGIPDSTTDRDDEEDSPMTNAAIGYVHETGSPAANIPARPWLVPGVMEARESTTNKLEAATKAALDGKMDQVQQNLHAAGIIAAASVKRKITTGEFEPLKPATVRQRRRNRGTKSMRAAEKEYLKLIDQGVSPEAAQTAAGIQPLLNTAQMRNAVTHVIRKRTGR